VGLFVDTAIALPTRNGGMGSGDPLEKKSGSGFVLSTHPSPAKNAQLRHHNGIIRGKKTPVMAKVKRSILWSAQANAFYYILYFHKRDTSLKSISHLSQFLFSVFFPQKNSLFHDQMASILLMLLYRSIQILYRLPSQEVET